MIRQPHIPIEREQRQLSIAARIALALVLALSAWGVIAFILVTP